MPTSLSSVTYYEIQSELRRRARRTAALQRRRDRLARRLDSLDDLIASMGGRVIGRVRMGPGRGRARNEKPLPEALHAVLKESTPMRVTDLAQKVQEAGYKTNSR